MQADSIGGSSLNSELSLEMVRIVPSVLWFAFALAALWIFQRSIRRDLIPRLSTFKGFGIELSFLRDQLDGAIKKVAADVSKGDRRGVLRRAELAQPYLRGGRLLWVDDNPDNNEEEIELFRSLGLRVKTVTSTTAALSELRSREYDVVISDYTRAEGESAGPDLARLMSEQDLYKWTIIYTGENPWGRPVPPFLFAITNRPDHLMHYVIDVMEREAAI